MKETLTLINVNKCRQSIIRTHNLKEKGVSG